MSELIFGFHAVRACLVERPGDVRRLLVQVGRRDARANEAIGIAKAAGVAVQSVDRRVLERRTGGGAHQGVAVECASPMVASEAELELRWPLAERPLLLVLDGVTDPRNLGACLRTALGAGVDAVLLPKHRSAGLTAAALKTASGAAEHLFIVEVTNLARRIAWLQSQGVWVVGASRDAPQRWCELDYRDATAIVVGGEEKGVRRLTRERCDQLVSLPLAGGLESLNVAVATGALLFEVVRQRQAR